MGARSRATCLLGLDLLRLLFSISRDAPREEDTNRKAAQKDANAMATQRALRTPTFWALAVCFTTFAALTFHLVPLMAERRVSPVLMLTTMAAIGPAQVLARVLWPIVHIHKIWNQRLPAANRKASHW